MEYFLAELGDGVGVICFVVFLLVMVIGLSGELKACHKDACKADQRMPDGRYTNRDSF